MLGSTEQRDLVDPATSHLGRQNGMSGDRTRFPGAGYRREDGRRAYKRRGRN